MSYPIDVPASFVPAVGLAFGQPDSAAVFVDATHPLPVRSARSGTPSVPLAGSAATAERAGPFIPEPDRPIHVTLSGSWTGSVTLLRSIDGGMTAHPLTLAGAAWGVFTANANEAVAEESVAGASYYLDLAPVSGTIAYQVMQ